MTTKIHNIDHVGEIYAVHFTPDGKMIVGGEEGFFVFGENLNEIWHNAERIASVATLPDGNLVTQNLSSNDITIYNGKAILRTWHVKPMEFCNIIVHEDLSRILIPAESQNKILVYDLHGGLDFIIFPNMTSPDWICEFDESHLIITCMHDDSADSGLVGLFPIDMNSVALWKTKLDTANAVCYDSANELIIVGGKYCIHILSTSGVFKLYNKLKSASLYTIAPISPT